MSIWDEEGKELVEKLNSLTDELKIKELCDEIVHKIKTKYQEPNSRKTPLATVRKAILTAYPDTETQNHPWQYFTNKGKGNIERYQHLALKYLTFSSEEWDVIGNEARQEWKKQQSENKPVTKELTLEDMNINQLGLDEDTQKLVSEAIAYSGISLADFMRKSCTIYANTLLGKVRQKDDDLSGISTTQLLSDKYKTHPGRAEELTRRAIYALEVHNNNCTEKAQKWHINQTAIQTLTGSKPATIKKILENYQIRINDHNTKHNLNPYDNRKTDKITDVIKLAEKVQDGLNIN